MDKLNFMKWHSLLRDPNDLPQRINKYEESEDVMVIERILHNVHHEKMKWDYRMLSCNFYYGHWEPNGDEGWRMRTKDYGDCGKFGGFNHDESYYKNIQCTDCLFLEDIEDLNEEDKNFVLNNCPYDERMGCYITRSIVGWTYFPNEDEFMEENKDLI